MPSEGDENKPMLFLSISPPSPEQSANLAKGMSVNGQELAPPRFHRVSWRDGQVFEESDDPDRTQEAFPTPAFISRSVAAQRERTSSTELKIPRNKQSKSGGAFQQCVSNNTFARVVHGVLDESDCAELISLINDKGFTPALLNIGRGRQKLEPFVRNGHRVITDSTAVAAWLFEVLKPYLPETMHGGPLVELNDRLRFLCYTPGQEFATHFDGNYRRPHGHPRAGDSSRVTVQIYLHDVPEENGGATTFIFGSEGDNLPCQPKAGSVLLFSQDLAHEGSLLKTGLKYTVRTEAMYGPGGLMRD